MELEKHRWVTPGKYGLPLLMVLVMQLREEGFIRGREEGLARGRDERLVRGREERELNTS